MAARRCGALAAMTHRHHPPHFPPPLAPFGGLPPPAPDWFTQALADVPERLEVKVQGAPIEALAWGRVGDPGLLMMLVMMCVV